MIEVRGLTWRAGEETILDNISFTIKDGEYTAVLGPNGAGKSSLLRILLGRITDYSGEVLIDTFPISKWMRSNHIGYLPQREQVPAQFPGTAGDIVKLGLIARYGAFRALPQDAAGRVRGALEKTGALHLERRFIGSLSGGELQRVLLARALAGESGYLFLDEPEAGVDAHQVGEFYALLDRVHSEGRTVLLVSHDINMVLHTVPNVLCLNRTLHSHSSRELVSADVIERTYGTVVRILERH
jgi:zinc transport system ATP-binding protein